MSQLRDMLKTCVAQNREEWRKAIKLFRQQNAVQPPTFRNQGR